MMMNENRLRWASRRGMLELDLILLPFLENIFPSLSDEQKSLYEKLLESEDQDLFSWLMQRVEPQDPELKIIVDIILDNTGMKVED